MYISPDKMDITALPRSLHMYCDLIGIGNLLNLAEAAGGRQIYIPKKDCILKYFVISQIRKEYNGHNIKALAEKYSVAERTVYKYLSYK